MKRSKLNFAIAACISLIPAYGLTCAAAHASPTATLAPEIQACIWEENNQEVAAVSLNGKELICFRSESGSGLAAERAEDLAVRIEEIIQDKRVDANEMLPAKAGTLATIQCAGNTVLSFDANLAVGDSKDVAQSTIELSLKVVNGIRTACGVPSLPSSFLKLTEQVSQDTSGSASSAFSGHASWYGGKFHGRRTSDGSVYDQEKMTAAHRSLPFGTKLLVMNRKTGATCVVEVNDRGPFVGDRVIDLSRAAARQLNMLGAGVALVDCLVLGNN